MDFLLPNSLAVTNRLFFLHSEETSIKITIAVDMFQFFIISSIGYSMQIPNSPLLQQSFVVFVLLPDQIEKMIQISNHKLENANPLLRSSLGLVD